MAPLGEQRLISYNVGVGPIPQDAPLTKSWTPLTQRAFLTQIRTILTVKGIYDEKEGAFYEKNVSLAQTMTTMAQ